LQSVQQLAEDIAVNLLFEYQQTDADRDEPLWFSTKYFWASTTVGLNASDRMIVTNCSTLVMCLSLVFSEKQSRNSAAQTSLLKANLRRLG